MTDKSNPDLKEPNTENPPEPNSQLNPPSDFTNSTSAESIDIKSETTTISNLDVKNPDIETHQDPSPPLSTSDFSNSTPAESIDIKSETSPRKPKFDLKIDLNLLNTEDNQDTGSKSSSHARFPNPSQPGFMQDTQSTRHRNQKESTPSNHQISSKGSNTARFKFDESSTLYKNTASRNGKIPDIPVPNSTKPFVPPGIRGTSYNSMINGTYQLPNGFNNEKPSLSKSFSKDQLSKNPTLKPISDTKLNTPQSKKKPSGIKKSPSQQSAYPQPHEIGYNAKEIAFNTKNNNDEINQTFVSEISSFNDLIEGNTSENNPSSNTNPNNSAFIDQNPFSIDFFLNNNEETSKQDTLLVEKPTRIEIISPENPIKNETSHLEINQEKQNTIENPEQFDQKPISQPTSNIEDESNATSTNVEIHPIEIDDQANGINPLDTKQDKPNTTIDNSEQLDQKPISQNTSSIEEQSQREIENKPESTSNNIEDLPKTDIQVNEINLLEINPEKSNAIDNPEQSDQKPISQNTSNIEDESQNEIENKLETTSNNAEDLPKTDIQVNETNLLEINPEKSNAIDNPEQSDQKNTSNIEDESQNEINPLDTEQDKPKTTSTYVEATNKNHKTSHYSKILWFVVPIIGMGLLSAYNSSGENALEPSTNTNNFLLPSTLPSAPVDNTSWYGNLQSYISEHSTAVILSSIASIGFGIKKLLKKQPLKAVSSIPENTHQTVVDNVVAPIVNDSQPEPRLETIQEKPPTLQIDAEPNAFTPPPVVIQEDNQQIKLDSNTPDTTKTESNSNDLDNQLPLKNEITQIEPVTEIRPPESGITQTPNQTDKVIKPISMVYPPIVVKTENAHWLVRFFRHILNIAKYIGNKIYGALYSPKEDSFKENVKNINKIGLFSHQKDIPINDTSIREEQINVLKG